MYNQNTQHIDTTHTSIKDLIRQINTLLNIKDNLEYPLEANIQQYDLLKNEFREKIPHAYENFNPKMFSTDITSIKDLISIASTLNNTLSIKEKFKEEVFTDLNDYLCMKLRPPHLLEKASTYNTKEICTVFDISTSTLKRYEALGLPKTSKLNRNKKYNVKEANKWILENIGIEPDFSYEV